MLPVRVLLVDDDTLVRRAVRQILEAADDLRWSVRPVTATEP